MTVSTQDTSQSTAFINSNIERIFSNFVSRMKNIKLNKKHRSDLDLKSFEQLESKKTLHSFKNLM